MILMDTMIDTGADLLVRHPDVIACLLNVDLKMRDMVKTEAFIKSASNG